MQAWGKQASPSTAVELLQSTGWWRPHEQLCLLKANRSETFPADVQVSPGRSVPAGDTSCIYHSSVPQRRVELAAGTLRMLTITSTGYFPHCLTAPANQD